MTARPVLDLGAVVEEAVARHVALLRADLPSLLATALHAAQSEPLLPLAVILELSPAA